jgi:hypothetical protein
MFHCIHSISLRPLMAIIAAIWVLRAAVPSLATNYAGNVLYYLPIPAGFNTETISSVAAGQTVGALNSSPNGSAATRLPLRLPSVPVACSCSAAGDPAHRFCEIIMAPPRG